MCAAFLASSGWSKAAFAPMGLAPASARHMKTTCASALQHCCPNTMGTLYSEHLTWLHRVNPAFKLVCMAVLSTLLFMLQSPVVMLACAVVCAALWLSLGR